MGTAHRLAVAVLATVATAATAGEPEDDTNALRLADQAPAAAQADRSWRASVEAAHTHSAPAGPNTWTEEDRLSFDFVYDGRVAPELRAVFSDRLDLTHGNATPRESNVNTLREAYASWQKSPQEIIDLGRVNLRYGVAVGYNPTDYFKANAVRFVVSPDPASLRENRLGTIVVQGQKLWSDSSLSAAYSPRLDGAASDQTFSLDVGATNFSNRWLVAASHKLSPSFSPQVMLFGGEDMPTQLGLNLSALVNSSTVAFAEVSAGRGPSLAEQAAALVGHDNSQERAALGFTTTTNFNLALTAEAEYNSAAPDRAQWDALRMSNPLSALRLLGVARALQDLPVRKAVFIHGLWQDMLIKHLDLQGFVRGDLETNSRTQWLELRYHWTRVDVELQWQVNSGAPGSVYGTVPPRRSTQAVLRVFL
jgi:hypothetical protein